MSERPSAERRENAVFPIKGYLMLNAGVWVFSVLMVVLVKLFIVDLAGIVFFAVIVPIGFGAVSLFDALYDRLAAPPEADPPEATQR